MIRVLLCDDAAELRRLVAVLLELDGGFELVGEAADGEQAVELAGRHAPDLVLLDLSMPVMDGLEALPLLRDASPGSRVVVYSGLDAARMESRARELGAHAYLEKGLDPDSLVAALHEAVREAAGS